MRALSIEHVSKSFGRTRVLNDVTLAVEPQTITAILGPSGCGKTTLLRIVAGFERADAGTVSIGERVVSGVGRPVPPERRDIGYVAQEGALFPHLNVAQNITFGLPLRERLRKRRVAELLDLVQLDHEYARRQPHELSGGQQQRVALARALARRPAIVLLDEPFSALDTGLRAQTRAAVSSALRAEGVTALLVTHDQGEALSFADQVAIMDGGQFTQVGPGPVVYRDPADLDTARLLGPTVVLAGEVSNGRAQCALGSLTLRRPMPDGPATVVLRPEQLRPIESVGGEASAGVGVVTSVAYFGADTVLTVQLSTGESVDCRVPDGDQPVIGERVRLAVVGAVHAFEAFEDRPQSRGDTGSTRAI